MSRERTVVDAPMPQDVTCVPLPQILKEQLLEAVKVISQEHASNVPR